MVAADQSSREHDEHCGDTEGIARQVRAVRDRYWGAKTGLNHVVPDDELEGDKIHCRQFYRANKNEPIQHGDQGLWKQYEIRSGHRRDGPTGPQDGVIAHEDMTYTAENRTRQVKTQVSYMTEFIVYIISEYKQKIHIPKNMHKVGMQEGIGYELPQFRPLGG